MPIGSSQSRPLPARKQVVVSGGFDDIKSRDLRFLEEASKLGDVSVLLWTDSVIARVSGKPPKFPLAEREYFLNGIRYVTRVLPVAEEPTPNSLPNALLQQEWIWAEAPGPSAQNHEVLCRARNICYHLFSPDDLKGFPEPPPMPSSPGRKKVIATGCYDWLHSGHIRFAEEASSYGDLYICIGSDANVRLLKGPGHPLLSEQERRYLVGSIKFVKQALITSGSGWLDADPEIRRLRPDIYVVNEDGDKGGKREYCQSLGIEYLVLKRTPAAGLRERSSTQLRGF